MAADPRLVLALQRFYTRSQVDAAYQTALAAHLSREQEVTIESVTGEGGTTTGRLIGNPASIMDACEEVLRAMDDADDDTGTLVPGTTHVNFSKRYVSS